MKTLGVLVAEVVGDLELQVRSVVVARPERLVALVHVLLVGTRAVGHESLDRLAVVAQLRDERIFEGLNIGPGRSEGCPVVPGEHGSDAGPLLFADEARVRFVDPGPPDGEARVAPGGAARRSGTERWGASSPTGQGCTIRSGGTRCTRAGRGRSWWSRPAAGA